MAEAKTFWSSFSDGLLDWLYPPQCGLCGRAGEPAVCAVCLSEMLPTGRGRDPHAAEELAFRISAYEYEGRAAQAVKRLKFERVTSLAEFMAEAVSEVACDHDLLG